MAEYKTTDCYLRFISWQPPFKISMFSSLLITDPDISDLRSALSPVGVRASEHNTEISVKSSLQLLNYYTTILNIYRVDKFELGNGQYLF